MFCSILLADTVSSIILIFHQPLLIQCRLFHKGRAVKGTLLLNKKVQYLSQLVDMCSLSLQLIKKCCMSYRSCSTSVLLDFGTLINYSVLLDFGILINCYVIYPSFHSIFFLNLNSIICSLRLCLLTLTIVLDCLPFALILLYRIFQNIFIDKFDLFLVHS